MMEVTRAEYNEVAGVETPKQPAIPEYGQHIWDWWWELNTRRPPGFDQLAPISFIEIASWVFLTNKKVSPEEIGILIAMDNAWMSVISEEREAKREREKERAEMEKAKGGGKRVRRR